MNAAESYILCEGYHDRAFWAGLLKHFNCIDPGFATGTHTHRDFIYDPWSAEVKGGQYAFHSRSGHFIRVVPAHGKDNLKPFARQRRALRGQKTLTRLLVNTDSDRDADETTNTMSPISFDSLLLLAQEFDPAAVAQGTHRINMDNGQTTVVLAEWSASDEVLDGIPNQNTLERLISAAIIAVHPEYGPAVENWLRSRPSPPPPNPKEHAFSYLAGWYADRGSYEALCTTLWGDPAIAQELETRVRSLPFWETIAEMTA